MVNIKTLKLYLIAFLSFVSLSTFAETQLNAMVDRNKVYEMDTLNLTIQGQIDMDFSFGGLMNFSLGQDESPETTDLEKDFEILDKQQSYNMQSINGESKAQVVWRYTLAPKNVGILEIPPMKYKDAETASITVTVIEGKAPKNSSEPPAIFLEVETDKTEAYVQEQIIYTLRLYTQGLVNGELSDPSSTEAIIEPFGEQKKYYRMAYNQRYEVVERQYLIFPQKSGKLTIDKQTFQGVSLKHGRRTRMKDMSDSVEMSIKPPANGFTGKNWLPATSLFLNEEWQGDPDALQVGDSITRKVELSALGLLGSGLPPITMPESPLYKLYTDKPQTESILHESGAQAKRTDSFAVVAIKNGDIQLNEIRIPWWDTVNDVERVAIIPAKKLSIAVNPDLPLINTKPKQVTKDSKQATEKMDQTDSIDPNDALILDNTASNISNNNHLWQTISGILLLLWLVTCVYFAKKVRELRDKLHAIPTPKQQTQIEEKTLFNKAVSSVKADDKSMVQIVLTWLEVNQKALTPSLKIASLQDIKQLAPTIYKRLKAYEQGLYSPNASSDYDKTKLIDELKAFRQHHNLEAKKTSKQNKTNSKLKAKTLEPFYQ